MDSLSGQRKRASRPSKCSSDTPTTVTTPQLKEAPECTDIAALAISPAPEVRPTPVIIPVSECRRSSRKKIIKFDVRDLLNKNRKPHKIQIEARIDSNVPSTSKLTTTTSGETASNNSGLNVGGDLSSKQKTFMEKSAIFRRFSISQEQTKPPPPPIPMPPTIMSKVGDNKDMSCSTSSSGKRINRTQEYYSNVMLKPKQTTSLIVAQMESNARSVDTKRKSLNKTLEGEGQTLDKQDVEVVPQQQQKRRGRPPKTRPQDITSADEVNDENNTSTKSNTYPQKLTPEKATNWKEYKACLAQQTTVSVDAAVTNQSIVSQDMAKPTESVTTAQEGSTIYTLSDNPKECSEYTKIGLIENIKYDSKCMDQVEKSDLNSSQKPLYPSKNTEAITEIILSVENNINVIDDVNECRQLENDKESVASSEEIKKELDKLATDTTTEDSIHPSQSEKEVASMTRESTTKDEVLEEKSIILSRTSSVSESENNECTELSAIALQNSASKDLSSERLSLNSYGEEKKLPMTKRSKRLQYKNKRTGNTRSKPIDASFGEIKNDNNENPPTSDDNSKQSDESNESINTCIRETADELKAEGVSQSSIDLEVVNEEIYPPIANPEQNEVQNFNSDSNSSISENKTTESDVISPNNVTTADDDEQPSKGDFAENVDQTIEKAYQELGKNEFGDCQTSSTSKTKEKNVSKQRKSLRNRKETNKLDVQEDDLKRKEQKMEDEVVVSAKDQCKDVLEQVQQGSLTEQCQEHATDKPKLEEEVSIKKHVTDADSGSTNIRESSVTATQVFPVVTKINETITKPQVNTDQDTNSILNISNIDCKIDVGSEQETINKPTIKISSPCTDKPTSAKKTQINTDEDIQSISNATNIECKTDEGSEQESNNKSTIKKSRSSTEKPISAKRKSLRIQKDCSPEKCDDNGKQAVVVEECYTMALKEECATQPNLLLEGPVEVSKRKPRKSRFKNLHGPDTESELGAAVEKNIPMNDHFISSEELKTNEYQMIEVTLNTDGSSILPPTNDITTTIKTLDCPAETEESQIIPSTNFESVKNLSTDIEPHTTLVDEIGTTPSKDLPQSLDIPSTSHVEPTNDYVIKNVSIETNTLLDILRTVHSNKKAAQQVDAQQTFNAVSAAEVDDTRLAHQVEADKKSDSVPQLSDPVAITDASTGIQDTGIASPLEANSTLVPELHDSLVIAVTEAGKDDSVVPPLGKPQNTTDSTAVVPDREDVTNISQEHHAKDIKLKKKLVDYSSKSNSPKRSGSASPLTLKKSQNSPCRSDSSSPLTLKKVNISPSRSDTSSPSTFNKKVTPRRYERRSRRGDEDSTHKTLEETFAEIAALSSKAVLDMSTNETELIDGDNTTSINNDKESEEKFPIDVEQKEKSDDLDTTVNNQETQEFIEVNTPTRRTRRSGKVQSPINNCIHRDDLSQEINKDRENLATTSDTIPLASNKSVDDVKKIEEGDIPISINDPYVSYDKDSNISTVAIDSHLEDKSECPQSTKKIEDAANDDLSIDSSSISIDIIVSSTRIEGEANQETSGLLPLADSTHTELTDTTKIEVESQTLNSAKKSDSTLTKNESKSSNRKSSKKIKSSEKIESGKTEDRGSAIKTPTPPPKRGRKAKPAQQEQPTSSAHSNNVAKKKVNKDQPLSSSGENKKGEHPPDFDSELMSVCLPEKTVDDKMAKKKRQRKLKEAFEAALNDGTAELKNLDTLTPASSPTFGLSFLNKSPIPDQSEADSRCSIATESGATTTLTEPEEDPDPLKDIEKFIEDGVNLLKKGYKLDDDSVDNVIPSKTSEEEQQESEINQTTQDHQSLNKEILFTTFETPADTPLATPSATPPPKSPESAVILCDEQQTSSGVRRSHRIKLITKTPKALVGRGLVRDKERFSIKDDVETKSHYTLDDHLLDLAEVEAKNAKFLKEMEERLSNFHVIKENEYKCERVISKEARKMICDCFLTADEEVRGELACGEDCLNRLLMIECGTECNVKERCTNKRFQKYLCSPCRVFRTEKKGFGIMADIEILPGEFIMEYVGEVIDTEEFERRRFAYSQEKNRHYYFMALRSDAIIDATIKGNISRFINHSCDPNAETQKWTVNGELRIGFFSRKSIMPGEEITFDYQYQRYGREAQRCYCESANCRGWIGQEPNSDEGEQIDDDDDETDDEDDEEEDASNLLEEDDEDSDASVSDPDEVQKKLEMAAAQAEAELLTPITLDEKITNKEVEEKSKENEQAECIKPGVEEDSKSKFKKLLSKMAEKYAAKHKQSKKEQKLQRKKKSKESSSELASKQRSLEDPDIEDEVEFLSRCGLKTQSDTLRLSRLMVRAKLVQTRLNLLDILRKGELPCRRLFLDYHGLRLVHGWMSEDAGNMQIRLALLQTLELLPIANKTVLTDSKVMQVVRNWCGSNAAIPSPNDDSLSSNSNSQDGSIQPINSENFQEISDCVELQKLALKLITTWDGLPEIFRIPKKERIEQMKEHEREADRQYAETEGDRYSTDRYRTNRFGRRLNTTTNRFVKPHNSKQLQQQNNVNAMRTTNMLTPENTTNCLSKTQRREMFAAKVARDEAEKRMAEERREFETKCRFFGLDPKKTRPQDVPFCVNPATGQWYSVERKPINTPPSYAHVQVPEKTKSTNPIDYQLPAVCSTLPPQWKFAITPLGQIYYYHVQYRVPQWTPPSPAQLQHCQISVDDGDSGNEHTPTTGPDSSDDDDDILIGMDSAQLKAYIDRKVESRRQKRYQRLVDERAISPRREEDRIYNQLEVRKYKENKEKIRKRKEEIRRRRAEALRQTSLNMCTLGSLTDSITSSAKIVADDESAGVLPIQDYLLSSDEDVDIKTEVNSPLIDKIVEGDKIVDELDALTTKRPLKRPLPPHRDLNEPMPSSSSSASAAAAINALTAIERQEYKKRKMEKKDKRKPKEQDAKYRRTKEKFRCEIAGIIVHHLKPYRKESCCVGRIKSDEDFNHLARKLTHFVMIKELKYCESVGQTLVVTESVKNKSREFIKKYMAKYGDVYVKPVNDPEFKDIPFTL